MGYENCENCKDRVWMGDVDKAYYEYPIICRKCEEKISYNSKPDASKIKKVVIPETEVKMVCTLSSQKYRDGIKNRETDNTRYIELNPDTEFKRIETPKPLADDEVSVYDFNYNKIYALKADNGIFLLTKVESFHSATCWFFDDMKANCSEQRFCYGLSTESLKEALEYFTVYEIDDQETLFQWCLDEARRAKGE